ncbi:MAG: Uncharacterised protein [Cellvibrionales bacterium UBA7375]|nr:MAG: Uncharacterised protein [Cellvibrionales bacterium UBA7375]
MNTLLKRLLTGLISLILLTVAAIFVATLVVDPNKFKPDIKSAAASAGIKLGIEGDMVWQLFPLGISIDKVNLALSDQSMAGSADQLSISLNLSTIFALLNQSSQFPISQLSISNGLVLYALPNSLPLQFSQIDLSIDNLNSAGQKFPISLKLVAPQSIKISLKSKIGLKMSDQALTDISVADLQLKVNQLTINGYFEASDNLSKIQGQINTETFDLIQQLKLAKRFIPDLLVPQMADANALKNITFDSFFDIETNGYSNIQTAVSIDEQLIDIDVDIDQSEYKLQTVVSGKRLNLDAFKTKAQGSSNNSMLFAPLAIPMAVWHGQSQLELNFMAIDIGKTSLKNVYANLFGNQNKFKLTSFNGEIFDGFLNASASLNLQNREPSFSLSTSLRNIDLNNLSDSLDNISLGGRLNIDTDIQGTGYTFESIIESIKGDGNLSITSPAYKGFNLEQTFCNAAALFGGKPIPKTIWSDHTELDDFNGKLQFKNGRLLLNDYKTKLASIDIYGNGEINLSSQRYSINTTALATQSTSSPNGCNINPMIVKREIPFRCKGALGSNIKCKPDNNLIQTLLLPPIL